MHHFFGWPDEIVLLCISSLDQSDISRITQACRHAQRLLTPTLYAIGYRTALPWAAKNNQKQTVEHALKYSRPEKTVLFKALVAAAQHDHVEIAELLLDHSAPTELELELEEGQASAGIFHYEARPWKHSPLVAAIVAGHPAVVSLLLAHDARTDVPGQWGYSPLHHACEKHKAPVCVPLLLAAGADVHARNQDGMTALDLASEHRGYRRTPSRAILRHLFLATGGSVLALPSSSGASIVRRIISNGDEDCKRPVLEFGISLIPAIASSEILLAAAAVGDEENVKELLQVGAQGLDVEGTTDRAGNNTLMLAVKHGHNAVLQVILQRVGGKIQIRRN
ncbi:ankyrin repeat-containing domain protein [Aspergillus pseudoustus]|uniref:Ankyrin repeat-containing domain protein n=1 Tax=Aspergillus pseudoustus TaxID=1810923 RepID=A0ABR4JVQ7_9EURO